MSSREAHVIVFSSYQILPSAGSTVNGHWIERIRREAVFDGPGKRSSEQFVADHLGALEAAFVVRREHVRLKPRPELRWHVVTGDGRECATTWFLEYPLNPSINNGLL